MYNESDEQLEMLGAAITTNEIKQQPDLWLETLAIYKANKSEIKKFLNRIIQATPTQPIRVIFTGAGTSQYVGDTVLAGLNRGEKYNQFNFESIATTEIVSNPHDVLYPDVPTILVSFARSGNSPESLAAVDIANQIVTNMFHLVITCAPEGALAQIAQDNEKAFLLLQPAGANDKGFAMTGAFSCMCLSVILIFGKQTLAEKDLYVSVISSMGRDVILREQELQLVNEKTYDRVVYLGSGAFTGLAHEAQLKILELTAGEIATLYDSSMGFRHGPKSFVNKQTIAFVFESNDSYTRDYDIDILEELKKDGDAAAIIGIGQKGQRNFDGDNFEFSESSIILPDSYLALPSIMVAQTIALLAAIKVGNTPDTPSANGTVNRVVKGVTIHEL